jgi:hypothetical protein
MAKYQGDSVVGNVPAVPVVIADANEAINSICESVLSQSVMSGTSYAEAHAYASRYVFIRNLVNGEMEVTETSVTLKR